MKMINETYSASSVHFEERHPVDEALGCMIPIVIGISFLALAVVQTLKHLIP